MKLRINARKFPRARDAEIGKIYAGTGEYTAVRYIAIRQAGSTITSFDVAIVKIAGINGEPCEPVVCPAFKESNTRFELLGDYRGVFHEIKN